MSLGLVCNFYNEKDSLPGLLECAKWFDDVFFLNCGPNGAKSNDGSIELIESAGCRLKFDDVMRGFGKIRTRLIHESKCDWVMIMDCDERFYPITPVLSCVGSEKYPDTLTPHVTCGIIEPIFNQGQHLKAMIEVASPEVMAIRTCRRHWFQDPAIWGSVDSATYKPCQNWREIPDWQLRVIRNDPRVFFEPERKMHEHLKFSPTWSEPHWYSGDQVHGPFHEHFHCHFKPLHAAKNQQDMQTYQSLDKGLTEGMWLENAEGVK